MFVACGNPTGDKHTISTLLIKPMFWKFVWLNFTATHTTVVTKLVVLLEVSQLFFVFRNHNSSIFYLAEVYFILSIFVFSFLCIYQSKVQHSDCTMCVKLLKVYNTS